MRNGMPIGPTLAVLLVVASQALATLTEAAPMQVIVREAERHTIYHSPQTPGYTSWAGIWTMPDGGVMVSFTQITGPLDGWKQRAPADILKRLPSAQRNIPAYDMTGLLQENLTLRSTDKGATWQKHASDTYNSAMNGYCVGSVLVLADGTLLRTGWGQALTYTDVRPTGFLQRSTDGGKTWGAPEYLSADEHLQTCPTRLRRLRDGRVLVTGGTVAFDPSNWHWDDLGPGVRHCLWVGDAAGKSWGEPLYVADGPGNACEEWDTAELENGDLLAVLRAITYDAAGRCTNQDRRQSILTKKGDTWTPGAIGPTPFPHDGHPELLKTREGIILHVAPSGISWTADRGATWTKLDSPGTGYYPHATQLEDGTILAVGHIGSDDPYGKTDQAIVMNRLRVEVR
jgi:hypothetical protein